MNASANHAGWYCGRWNGVSGGTTPGRSARSIHAWNAGTNSIDLPIVYAGGAGALKRDLPQILA